MGGKIKNVTRMDFSVPIEIAEAIRALPPRVRGNLSAHVTNTFRGLLSGDSPYAMIAKLREENSRLRNILRDINRLSNISY